MDSEHTHRYTFLRQETRPTKTGYNYSVQERLIEDVWVCGICLDYRRVPVRREVPNACGFGWVEIPTQGETE